MTAVYHNLYATIFGHDHILLAANQGQINVKAITKTIWSWSYIFYVKTILNNSV